MLGPDQSALSFSRRPSQSRSPCCRLRKRIWAGCFSRSLLPGVWSYWVFLLSCVNNLHKTVGKSQQLRVFRKTSWLSSALMKLQCSCTYFALMLRNYDIITVHRCLLWRHNVARRSWWWRLYFMSMVLSRIWLRFVNCTYFRKKKHLDQCLMAYAVSSNPSCSGFEPQLRRGLVSKSFHHIGWVATILPVSLQEVHQNILLWSNTRFKRDR